MSRKYSAWASNQPVINIDSSMMKLTTITGNEQDQLKTMDRVESIPHMYMNIDAPPPPVKKIDARMVQPTVMLSRQNSSFFAPPTGFSPPMNSQTKLWPNTKSTIAFDSTSSSSKRPHKHKHHHHHHHHHGKHHHHHHNHRHRAKSAETIRNRQHQAIVSPTKMIITNPQYIEQDQQQLVQQQQPMIVYREVGNGESYTVDPNGLATVPYTADNETTFVDDQQTPIFAYATDQQTLVNDGNMQQVFFTPEQETIVHQTDPFTYLPQQQQQLQQSPQIVYCTDPNLQFVQQQQQQQQQVVCLDNAPTTAIQPTIINQIPVFNPLSTTAASSPSIMTVPQTSLQRTASIIVHPQQQQSQPVQIIQQNPQIQPGQYLQITSPTPQIIQTVPNTPQILYQRPYDPVVIPAQNQQIAVNNSPLVALSQPSYAPTRLASTTSNTQTQGPTMFRHALLRTVADRTGVLSTNGVQLVQPSTTTTAAAAITTPK